MAAKPSSQANCKPALVAGAAKRRQPPAAGFPSRAEICPGGGVMVLASAAALPGAPASIILQFCKVSECGGTKSLDLF